MLLTELKEKDEIYKQLNRFEQTNINSKRRNKYPNIQLEEALNFQKRFAEHLASKKDAQNVATH
jgi:hypothetical protein